MYQVLIADDEAIIREGLKCLLDWESLGFLITDEASNGEQALEKLLNKNPEVALMDIRMPGASGLDVIRRSREAGYNGKIIILSGYSDFKYAQEAIRLGVEYYLTKPVDEEELTIILDTIRRRLDSERANADTAELYRTKARDAIVEEILLGRISEQNRLSGQDFTGLHMDADVYQVAICEKYNHGLQDSPYSFAELLRLANQDNNSFDAITLEYREVFLFKGSYAVGRFTSLLQHYSEEKTPPQKGSPLDHFFITYGRCVDSVSDISRSYREAHELIGRRFFCDQAQHTMGYQALPSLKGSVSLPVSGLLAEYSASLLDYIRTFNRNMLAETLSSLQQQLYNATDSISDIRIFLADLYLSVREKMSRLYSSANIPFSGNAEVIRFITSRYYLYEILLYFTEQFEGMMSAIGNSSRESVMDDILHYISHNYAENLTLENLAPLFGYNSSYLGKLFSKTVGENFNSYLDHIRIERSKELLMNEDAKIYTIAEKVGYRNADYFHTKFKKYTGMSPAEYRKRSRL